MIASQTDSGSLVSRVRFMHSLECQSSFKIEIILEIQVLDEPDDKNNNRTYWLSLPQEEELSFLQ